MNANRLEFLKSLAECIGSVFGDRCEVAIHDFSDLKKSLVYIRGNVTNRPLGSPISDMVYRLYKEFGDDAPNKFGHKSITEKGNVLKCSTTMLRDDEGKIEGCLCINFDVTDFSFLATAFNDFTFMAQESGTGSGNRNGKNSSPTSFAESMESAIDFAISDYGKVPAMMDKSDKLSVIQKLDKDGVFMIKGSVDYIAKVFGSSRYTIYSYLKQIRT